MSCDPMKRNQIRTLRSESLSPTRLQHSRLFKAAKKSFISPLRTRKDKHSKTSSPASCSSSSSSNSISSQSRSILSHLRNPRVSTRNFLRLPYVKKSKPVPVPVGQNVMQFLSSTCPRDVVPHILAYAGPQSAASLSQVNSHWKNVMDDEETWRVMCEDLYKWDSDQEDTPKCWKEYYRLSPCVPVDFATISSALSMATANGFLPTAEPSASGKSKDKKKPHFCKLRKAIRILIRPGTYELAESVRIQTAHNSIDITIEKMRLPETLFDATSEPNLSLTNLSYVEVMRGRQLQGQGSSTDVALEDTSISDSDEEIEESDDDVVLKSSLSFCQSNKPLFRVSRGGLVLRNIRLQHKAMGVDIWGGNAAIHVEPRTIKEDNNNPSASTTTNRASVVLESCEITSSTGRGIVVLGGGEATLSDCLVHSCAATGVYVGGTAQSKALIENTDVTCNGNGNRAGGIARVHSGIYLELGQTEIKNCNVSFNTASGIAVVQVEESHLTMMDTDVIGNGFMPLDFAFGMGNEDVGLLPAALLQEVSQSKFGNRMLIRGVPRPRSALSQNCPPMMSLMYFDDMLLGNEA